MKTIFLQNFRTTQLILIFVLLFTACKKDENNDPDPITPSGPTLKTTVTGRVTDTNGNVMIGVNVDLGTLSTVTDNRGYFLFVKADVAKERFVVIARKSGYFNCVRGKVTQSSDANYINLVMQELPPVVNISGGSGGIVNVIGGATITFPANAFIDHNGSAYTGQVKVYARHISPGADNFEAIVPGGDLMGVNAAGDEQSLYSLGMIEAKLYDNTGLNEVKLASGKSATLKFPIHASQNSAALSTIPMWHLDEETGIWQEEGQVTRTGNFYVGTVNHFTIWNVDDPSPRADVTGRVVVCQGNPVSGVVVTINGFTNVVTANDGSFYIWVPAGFTITAQALTMFNPFLLANSPSQSVIAIGGSVNTIPDIIIPCATRIIGNVKSCNGQDNSPAFIIASWNGGSAIQYTSSGIFNLFVPENKAVTLNASYNGSSQVKSLVTSTNGTIIDLANVFLCNASNNLVNTFQINDNGISTIYSVTITTYNSSFTDADSDGLFEDGQFLVTGIANPGAINCMINMHADDLLNDHFPLRTSASLNQVVITLGAQNFSSSAPNLSNTTNQLFYTEYAPVGGVVSGMYEFSVDSDTYVTSGIFSVVRDN